MSEVVNVAVIGCGIFGAEIALAARKCGVSVFVYEASPDILSGASKNNQNRLHLGFHYPRDLETGRQSIRGFDAFKTKYAECIEAGFRNAYFVAEHGSQTSMEAYLAFCDRLGRPYEVIAARDFPVPVQGVTAGILCDEVVYDCSILKSLVWEQLRRNDISVALKEKALRIERAGERLAIFSESRPPLLADVVINTSYANNNLLTSQLGYPAPQRLFEYTVVPIISLEIPKVGMTIVDGAFMTILPYGKSVHFLLYDVERTVVAKTIATQLDQAWLSAVSAPFSHIDKIKYFNSMIVACSRFVPALANAKLVGFLEGPRAVLARREDTDARPSIIDDYGSNYLTVFSGKIDHCMWVADDVQRKLRSRFNL